MITEWSKTGTVGKTTWKAMVHFLGDDHSEYNKSFFGTAYINDVLVISTQWHVSVNQTPRDLYRENDMFRAIDRFVEQIIMLAHDTEQVGSMDKNFYTRLDNVLKGKGWKAKA